MNASQELKWLQSLQSFLNELLTPIISDKTKRYKFLGAEQMRIWARAFTHETVSPTNNYEDLEYSGDTVLKWAFPKYMKRRFPKLDKAELTELHSHYMSKMTQASLSRKMGLPEHIRVTGMDRAILNLETDAFESFFGALEAVGDSLVDGTGTVYCYNMIIHLFKDVEIDENAAWGSAKTQVLQLFSRFDLPKVIEQSPGTKVVITVSEQLQRMLGRSYANNIIAQTSANRAKDAEYEAYRTVISALESRNLLDVTIGHSLEKGPITFAIDLRDEHIKFLSQFGVSVNNPTIGYATGATKKEAEMEAYKNALATLNSIGLSTQWAEATKIKMALADPAFADIMPFIDDKRQREGYDYIYFFIPRKTVTNKGAIVELVGVRSDGVHIVLSHTFGVDRESGFLQSKRKVLEEYATKVSN